MGAKAENRLTKTMNSRFDSHGVWNFGWMLLKMEGSRPSRDMEKKTRDWPSSITRITEVKPAMMASLTAVFSQTNGVLAMASATGAALPLKAV